ncbi:hypothetical protein D3C85_1878390 [compost metagenome]
MLMPGVSKRLNLPSRSTTPTLCCGTILMDSPTATMTIIKMMMPRKTATILRPLFSELQEWSFHGE